MRTGFARLPELAAAIAGRIRTGCPGRFKTVTHAQATSGAQVWDMLQAMSAIPGAVVAIGSGDFSADALKRTVRVMVFILAPFSRGTAADADGIWSLAEEVLDLFLPAAAAGGGLDYPAVAGIEFSPVSWTPLESDENISAFCLTLEGTEFLMENKQS